jgi:hypothetical protein
MRYVSEKGKIVAIPVFWRHVFQLHLLFLPPITVAVAQLVRASDCGSEGRRFEPG